MRLQTYYRGSKIHNYLLLFFLGITSSCIDRHFSLMGPENNSSEEDNSQYKTEIFNYPYGDEATDVKAEIIIDTKNELSCD